MTDKHQIADDLTTLAYPIEKLKHLDGNPRKGNVEAVKKSYEKFGQRKPIVATKDGEVISGNHQLAAARELGWNKIAVVFTDDDELTAKAFALADNRTADLGTYDDDLLADMLGAVSSDLEMLEATSFTEDDLYKLIGFDEVDEKELPEIPKKPKTKLGNIFKLGNHYLICGDATDKNLYLKFKNKINLCLTDPPYNVNYESNRKNISFSTIKNDNLSEEQFNNLLDKSFNNIEKSINENGVVYIFHGDSKSAPKIAFEKYFDKYFHKSSTLIWVKQNAGMGYQDYRVQHEPILYGWPKTNKNHIFYGDRKKTTILNFNKEAVQSYVHPTQKPIKLLEEIIKNSSKTNNWVLDNFSGSGATLIACENTKRKCLAIEFDPKYCDVIIERWENLTGQKAELIDEIKVAD